MNPFLTWLKNNWTIPVILALVIFVIYQHQAQKSLLDQAMRDNQASFQQQEQNLHDMQAAYEHDRQQQEAINQQYQQTISQLQTDYNQRITALETQTQTRRRTFVQETSGNPSAMADRLRTRLGWTTTPSIPPSSSTPQ